MVRIPLYIHGDPVHVNIRSEQRELFDDKGRLIRPKQRRVYVDFKRGVAPSWAQKIGLETFPMRNRPDEIEPGAWLAAYDSDADEWNDEEKQAVVAKLDAQGYLKVEKPRLKAPYPMYDQHRKTAQGRTIAQVIKDIENAYQTAGFNVHDAVAYEQENGNDARVIAALDALLDEPEAEPELVEDVVVA